MPIIRSAISILFALTLALGIQACSAPELGSTNASGGGGNFDSDDDTLPDNVSTIAVEIDASEVMRTGSDQISRDLGAGSVSVHQVDFDNSRPFNIRLNSSGLGIDSIENENGVVVIRFTERISNEEALNLVIRVELPNGDNLYGLLYETSGIEGATNRPIRVSVRSFYVYKTLFELLSSQQQLDDLLPCENLDECDNQYYAKFRAFRSLILAMDELDLGGPIAERTLTFEAAIQQLDDNVSLRESLRQQLSEIIGINNGDSEANITPFALGTRRGEITPEGLIRTRLSPNERYNSTYFGIGLDKNNIGISATHSNQQFDVGNSNQFLPAIQLSTTYLREQSNVVSTVEMPISRQTLTLLRGGDREVANTESLFLSQLPARLSNFPEECTPLPLISNDTRQTTKGSIVASRGVPLQVPSCLTDIPNTGERVEGWVHDPIFSLLYKSNEYFPNPDSSISEEEIPDYGSSPTWLSTAYTSDFRKYDLETLDEGFERQSEEEDSTDFSWEVHGLAPEENPTRTTIEDTEYGAVSFRTLITDDEFTVITETTEWDANRTSIGESQPNTDGTCDNPDFFASRTLSRDNATNTLSPAVQSCEDDILFAYNPLAEATGAYAFGRTQDALGHISENGQHIAFIDFDESRAGKLGTGLTIATAKRERPVVFNNDELFFIQGNVIELSETATTLYSVNGSRLAFNPDGSGCSAQLTLNYFGLNQEILPDSPDSATTAFSEQNPLRTDSSSANQLVIDSTACSTNNDGFINIRFPRALHIESELVLRGFVSRAFDPSSINAGNLISLVWEQDNVQGLIFAQKDR